METLMKIVVRTFFLFFGDKIKGDRTALVGLLTGILAIWELITGEGLFSALCGIASQISWFDAFCGIEETIYYSIMLALVMAVTTALKYLDTNEIGPAQMRANGYTEGNFARLEIYALVSALIFGVAIITGVWQMGFMSMLFALLPIWILFALVGLIKSA